MLDREKAVERFRKREEAPETVLVVVAAVVAVLDAVLRLVDREPGRAVLPPAANKLSFKSVLENLFKSIFILLYIS